MNKLLIGIGMFFGSTIGNYIPILWGKSLLSITSILWSVIRALWVFGSGIASQNI